jgi:hypothetical protein
VRRSTVEAVPQVPHEAAIEVPPVDGSSRLVRDGGVPAAFQTARDDPRELLQRSIDAEGESVTGHPASHREPDRGDLPLPDPDSGPTLDPTPRHAELGEDPDERLLHGTEKRVKVSLGLVEAQGQVADSLPRTVEGRLSSWGRRRSFVPAPLPRVITGSGEKRTRRSSAR